MEDRKIVLDQPTEQFNNEQHFKEVLKKCDPQLYMVKIALEETGVNPDIIPRIIRVLGNLNIGTGYGEIMILMKERRITQIKANESDILNMSVDNQKQVDLQ